MYIVAHFVGFVKSYLPPSNRSFVHPCCVLRPLETHDVANPVQSFDRGVPEIPQEDQSVGRGGGCCFQVGQHLSVAQLSHPGDLDQLESQLERCNAELPRKRRLASGGEMDPV